MIKRRRDIHNVRATTPTINNVDFFTIANISCVSIKTFTLRIKKNVFIMICDEEANL